MVKPSRIGVVTVTFNSGAVLRGFMDSLLKQTHREFFLYVVDNASSDDTLKVLAEYQDARIVLIRNEANTGVARGNNQGICAALDANCDAVLFINNDTEFDSDLLSALDDGSHRYQADMIVPKIAYYDEPDTLWYAGGYFNRWKGYMGIHCGLAEIDRGQFDQVRQVEYAPTCCMLVRSEVFKTVGVMDEQYFVYCDDTDFCFRAMRKGMKMIYAPAVRVLHKVSSLAGGDQSKFAQRYLTRGHIYFIRKNLGFWKSLWYLPVYQIRLLYKLIRRIVDLEQFIVREVAFFEGWKIPLPRTSIARGTLSRGTFVSS